MAKLSKLNPLAATVGAAVVASALSDPVAMAAENPFAAAKSAEGKCGDDKKGEGKCGEGKCGGGA